MGKASRRKRERHRMERPRGEVADKLAERLRLLDRSARAFDDGDEAEAGLLALHVRVLLHTGQSRSLFRLLDLERLTAFLDTASPMYVKETLPGGVVREGVDMTGSALTQVEMTGTKVRHLPLLDAMRPQQERWIDVRSWWNQRVLSPEPGRMLFGGTARFASRKDLVLWFANQDGGAHVDELLDPDFDELLHRYRSKVTFNNRSLPAPLHASIRQIAYEVLETAREHGLGTETTVDLGDVSDQ